jgi:hypothetical protein
VVKAHRNAKPPTNRIFEASLHHHRVAPILTAAMKWSLHGKPRNANGDLSNYDGSN